MCSRRAIHCRPIVVSCRNRRARTTLTLSHLPKPGKASSFHPWAVAGVKPISQMFGRRGSATLPDLIAALPGFRIDIARIPVVMAELKSDT